MMNKIESAVANLVNKTGTETDIATVKLLLDNQLTYEQLGTTIYVLQELASKAPQTQLTMLPIIMKMKVLMGIISD